MAFVVTPVVAFTIGFAALAAGGTAAAISASDKAEIKAKKLRTESAEEQKKLLASLPKPGDAKKKAQLAVAQKKRIRKLAGGDTLLTTETALGKGTGAPTLLGG